MIIHLLSIQFFRISSPADTGPNYSGSFMPTLIQWNDFVLPINYDSILAVCTFQVGKCGSIRQGMYIIHAPGELLMQEKNGNLIT